MTGGLQDGCRFEDENGDWIEFDDNFSSNHVGRYKKCGRWARPVFPTNRSLQGSPQTPYIFDDRADFQDVANAIKYWYDMSADDRLECGLAGREWVLGDESKMSARNMSSAMAVCIDECLRSWKPRQRFSLYKINQLEKIENVGIVVE